jgi:16S rRNA (guanine966-N2)-methyltransferase
MRIVAGKFRGTALATPKGAATRPTSDRVREALFNILEHGVEHFTLEGARVLDLFAGTGALGLEALSRGAKYALFIDDATEARGLIRRNIEALHLTGIAKIWRRSATGLGPAGNVEPFDLVFLDPPYGKGLGEQALTSAREGGWIRPGGVAILEEAAKSEITVPDGYEEIDRRTYGDTQVLFLRAT